MLYSGKGKGCYAKDSRDAVPPDLPRGPVPHLIVGIVGLPSPILHSRSRAHSIAGALSFRETINPTL